MKYQIKSILRKAAAFALAGVIALSLAACSIEMKSADTSANKTNGQTPSSSNTASSAQTANNTPAAKPGQTAPIALYPGYADLPVGFTVYLDCQLKDKNQPVEWSSSNPAAASVDTDGKITGVAPGEAVITVTLKNDPSTTATCGVYVEDTERKTVIAWEQEPAVKPGDLDGKTQEEFINLLNGDNTVAPPEPSPVPIEADPGEGETEIVFNEAEMKKILVKDISWRINFGIKPTETLGRESVPIKYKSFVGFAAEKKGGDTPLGKYQLKYGTAAWSADTSDYIKAFAYDGGYDGPNDPNTVPEQEILRTQYTLYTMEAGGKLSADGGQNQISGEDFFDAFMYFVANPKYADNTNPYLGAGGKSYWIWERNFERHEADRGGDTTDDVWTDNTNVVAYYYFVSDNRVLLGLEGFVPDANSSSLDSNHLALYSGTITRYIVWKRIK